MLKKKRVLAFSLIEAIDSLSAWTEISKPTEMIGLEAVSAVFRKLQAYLQYLYAQEKWLLKDPEVQRGIQALMILVGEAVQKLGARAADLQEYRELEEFYHTKIIRRFHEAAEGEEKIDDAGESADSKEALKIQKQGLKDLQMVKRDSDYELFYIRKENGHPFFTNALLRHVRLVGEFDETVFKVEGEDPLQKIPLLQDRDAHEAAREILRLAASQVDAFYEEAMRHKESELVFHLNKALMALMLAANARNLLSGEAAKNCASYFRDFLLFMRTALSTQGYQEGVKQRESLDSFVQRTLSLAHGLVHGLFLRNARRKETVHFIHQMLGTDSTKIPHTPFWNWLSESDEKLRAYLAEYPNGPLMKTLSAFREGEARLGFDPLFQENLPSELYTLKVEDLHVSVLRLPAPIRQKKINQPEIAEEFRAFLRGLERETHGQRHLLFNLQERNSWKEHARSVALEKLQQEPEFSKNLTVVTFCKSGEFYAQTGPYAELEDASSFLAAFQDQIESGETCGFHFPPEIDLEEIRRFTQEGLTFVHNQFFGARTKLSHQNRLDFIELFTQLFFLKLILLVKPDSISFTCKDAVDLGEAEATTFFSFLRMLGSDAAFSTEEKEFLLWMLYAPALLIRHRLIDSLCFARTLNALSLFDAALLANRKEIRDGIDQLLKRPMRTELRIAA